MRERPPCPPHPRARRMVWGACFQLSCFSIIHSSICELLLIVVWSFAFLTPSSHSSILGRTLGLCSNTAKHLTYLVPRLSRSKHDWQKKRLCLASFVLCWDERRWVCIGVRAVSRDKSGPTVGRHWQGVSPMTTPPQARLYDSRIHPPLLASGAGSS